MSLSNDERQALVELKNQGYSFTDAMGFIATSRLGKESKVSRDFTKVEPQDDSAGADLRRGFEGAKTSFQDGLERDRAIEQQDRNFVSQKFGKFAGGLRTAGDALGNVIGGAIRAVPGGTTVMNKVEDVISSGVERAASSRTFQSAQRGFEQLPEGVQRTLGDIGNVAMGAAGLGEALVAPGATRALSTGFREFSNAGIRAVGENGIQQAITRGLEPEQLMQRVARISKGKQANFEQRAGESVGEFLVNRQIFGDPEDITTQLYERMQTSKSRVDAGLASVGGTYKDNAVADALEQLGEREARVSSTRTPSPDSRRVIELTRKHDADGLTLSEVNEVKRLYERNVKLDFLRDNVSDGIAKANNVDTELRNFVELKAAQGGFDDVKALNRETMLSKQLLDDLGAEYAGQQGNNYVSLSDAFFLAEAASNPTALAAFGLKRAFSSKSSMSAVARLMSRNRAVTELPEGRVRGALQLPERGRTSAPADPITQLPARTQSTIDRQEIDRVQSQRQPALQADQDAIDQARSELDADLSGATRVSFGDNFVQNADGSAYRFSELPSWIPEQFRDQALLNRVLRNIEEGRNPRANATNEQELQALVMERIRRRAEAIKTQPKSGVFDNDVAFGIALALGGTYYLTAEDDTVLPVLAIGMIAANPQMRSAAIKNIEDMIKDAQKVASDTNAPKSRRSVAEKNIKRLTADRDKLIAEEGRAGR